MATTKRASDPTRRAAVQAYLAGTESIPVVAEKYSIAPVTLSAWLKQFRGQTNVEETPPEPRARPRVSAEADEVAALRRENERLKAKLRELLALVERL